MMPAAVILDDVPTFERNIAEQHCLQSQSAQPLDIIYEDAISHFTKPLTFSKRKNLYDALLKMYQNCCDDNWDNEGSVAVIESTFNYATKLISALPSDVLSPEIEADSDGDISFEWYLDRSKLLFISISPKGRISFAGRFPNNSKANGEEWIKHDEIPDEIIHYISKLKG